MVKIYLPVEHTNYIVTEGEGDIIPISPFIKPNELKEMPLK